MPKEKLYISSKLVLAIPMDECTFLETIKGEDVADRISRPGYKVTYPDGYVSWSPEGAFENANREVTPAEKVLMWPTGGAMKSVVDADVDQQADRGRAHKE